MEESKQKKLDETNLDVVELEALTILAGNFSFSLLVVESEASVSSRQHAAALIRRSLIVALCMVLVWIKIFKSI